MSDIAIHQLPAAGALTGAETVPIDDGAATRRTTVAALRAGLAAMAHGHTMAELAGLEAALDARAPLASPAFTGCLAVPAGSAAAPSIGIGGVPGTGLFAPAAGLAVAVAGTDAFRVDGSAAAIVKNDYPKLIFSSDAATQYETFYDVANNYIYHDFKRPGSYERWRSAAFLPVMDIREDGGIALGGGYGGEAMRVTPTGIAMNVVPTLPSFTVATLPTASARGLIYVSDGAAGRRLAVGDGVAWRWPDGSVVS